MACWGGTGAEALKTAIDSIFTPDGRIPMATEEYITKLVSCTADGASVNFGEKSGLLTRLGKDRDWLLKVHCANHRIELAVKHAFKDSKFEKVDEFYQANYNLLKNSGKILSEVKASAAALEIQNYKLTKITGTRFVGHRTNALRRLLDMWPAFKMAYENLIASALNEKTKGKLRGLHDKFCSYKMLCLVSTYLDLLEKTRPASKIFESEGLLPFDLKPVIEMTLSELDECIEDACTDGEFIDSNLARFRLVHDVNGEEDTRVVKSQFLKEGHSQKSPDQREYVFHTFDRLTFMNEESRQIASREKKEVGGKLKSLLQKRFQNSNEDLYETMRFIDPACWDNRKDYGNEVLAKFTEHFDSTLSKAGFDTRKVLAEWRSFKNYVKASQKGVDVKTLWQRIFQYKRDEYPNLCLCVEIIFSMSGSNSTVERAFSTLRLLLSDRRLSMKHTRMEQLLVIRGNDKNWSQEEREAILVRSVDIYLEKRRKKILTAASEPQAKRQKTAEQDSSNEDLSESEDTENYLSDIDSAERAESDSHDDLNED